MRGSRKPHNVIQRSSYKVENKERIPYFSLFPECRIVRPSSVSIASRRGMRAAASRFTARRASRTAWLAEIVRPLSCSVSRIASILATSAGKREKPVFTACATLSRFCGRFFGFCGALWRSAALSRGFEFTLCFYFASRFSMKMRASWMGVRPCAGTGCLTNRSSVGVLALNERIFVSARVRTTQPANFTPLA